MNQLPAMTRGPEFASVGLDRPAIQHSGQAARILVVDDHELIRVGIRSVLQSPGNSCPEILEAANLHDAMCIFRDTPGIDLVLLDLNMPDCRGLHGLRQFIEAFPRARIAVVSGTQDEFVVGQVRALGAVGYIAKGQTPRAMADLVLGLLQTDQECGQARARPNGFSQFPNSSKYDRVAELGPRHLEILDQVLFGCSNQEISTSIGLSLGTIKNYVSTILLAMDVKSRSHLISLFR